MFATLCSIEADTSQMITAMKPRRGRGGVFFYQQEFSVVLLFGLTELKAQISWVEDVSPLSSLCYWLIDHVYCRAKRSGRISCPFIRSFVHIANCDICRGPAKVVYDLNVTVVADDT
jgi:hypothetical protein